jgi:hypothetical protein
MIVFNISIYNSVSSFELRDRFVCLNGKCDCIWACDRSDRVSYWNRETGWKGILIWLWIVWCCDWKNFPNIKSTSLYIVVFDPYINPVCCGIYFLFVDFVISRMFEILLRGAEDLKRKPDWERSTHATAGELYQWSVAYL